MTDDCPPPIPESLRQYARDLRRNSSGGDDYPWDFARAIADRLDEIAGSLSSTERPQPFNGTLELTDAEFDAMERECFSRPVTQTPRRGFSSPGFDQGHDSEHDASPHSTKGE